jgi:hypothetical protein
MLQDAAVLSHLTSSTYHYWTHLDGNLAHYFWSAGESSNIISKSCCDMGYPDLVQARLTYNLSPCIGIVMGLLVLYFYLSPDYNATQVFFCSLSWGIEYGLHSVLNCVYTLAEASFVCEKPLNKLWFLVMYENDSCTELHELLSLSTIFHSHPTGFLLWVGFRKIWGGSPTLNKSGQLKQNQKNHS